MSLISSPSIQPSLDKQKGVVLVITLIVLVAMTLAAISLVRSVDTSNVIAGNLAFQRSALNAADAGIEDAINVLIPMLVANNALTCGQCPAGYQSRRQPVQEPPFQSWDAYWNGIANPRTLNVDALGNTVSYIVEAMCDGLGMAPPCLTSPPSSSASCEGNDLGRGGLPCSGKPQQYYRITTRVLGPHNSVAYTQTMLAM